ncbi:acetyl-CoA synthetase [Lewinella marina]|uniref:AMP-dependent synthetase n=1 Tax=Neolewinella marina TaxID=438751 RepID=A0A2G0CKD8_9BACT|nr:AMP-binding protein [Neolewinella marina]NJB84365.1 acetyl-CoA synthetase [Neolewinella marina]PHL00436.1 hypothetical protein CGL56_05235 [Neolewinella marina]
MIRQDEQSETTTTVDIQEEVQRMLEAYSGADIRVAHLLCDRHADAANGVVLQYEDATGGGTSCTYSEIRDLSIKFAAVLRGLGVGRGSRVATLLPRTPELLIAALATWRLGAVHLPVFRTFGPEAIQYRLHHGAATVIVTDAKNRPKLKHIQEPGHPVAVVTVQGGQHDLEELPDENDIPFWRSLHAAKEEIEAVAVSGDDPFILIYTSGTAGAPKGVEVPVKMLAPIEAYMRYGLGLVEADRYWNMADPGWAYGLFYALVGPLLIDQTTLFYNAPFSIQATYRILMKYGVTNLVTSPTVLRMMRTEGFPEGFRKNINLRVISCAGEPLGAEAMEWTQTHLGVALHDQYGQTEVGMVVANHQAPPLRQPLRPGSAGQALPGFRVVILGEDGTELPAGQSGELAIDTEQSPFFFFRGYLQDPARTAERFTEGGRYYLTGDTARQDADGYFYFTGRIDDVIKSSGYRIDPHEIERLLISHEAVTEAAVVGKADPVRGQIVKAFVVLRDGHGGSADLRENLQRLVREQLSGHAYPREIEFVDHLPRTPDGQVQRYQLREDAAA